MKSLDFILSSAEAMSAVRELVSTNGVTVNGDIYQTKNRPSVKQVTARLETATEEELSAILEECGFDSEDVSAPARVAEDEVVIDLSAEDVINVTTKEDVEIQAVLGEYVGESDSGFKFKLKSGGYIVVTGDRMFQLWNAGGLTEGYMMPFKPESIRPAPHIGYYNGIPNFSADERLTKVIDVNQKNKKKLRAKIAEIRALKLPNSIKEQRINALVDDAIEPIKLEKLSF